MPFIKRTILRLSLLSAILLATGSANAAMIELVFLDIDPMVQNNYVGDYIEADLVISGLELSDLGSFDIDITYDTSILEFSSYELGDQLGDLDLFEADDWSNGEYSKGIINVAELSYLTATELEGQLSSFTLATLGFYGVGEGVSELAVGYMDLGDANSIELDTVGTASGYVVVNPVPVPGAIWLLGSVLIGIVGLRKRNR
jgi:hypothetical protein